MPDPTHKLEIDWDLTKTKFSMPMSPGITAMIEYVLCAWLVLHNAVLSQAAPAESWLPLERAKHRKDQVTDIPGLQDKLTSKHYAGRICWLVTISQIMHRYLTCCRIH